MRTIHEAAQILDCKEQLQEDIRTFMMAFPAGYDDGQVRADADYITDALCDLVVVNFRQFEKDPETGQRFNA